MTAILTFIHVLTGSMAIGAGAVALSVRKGGRPHILAGRWFFGSMLVMAVAGGGMAVMISQAINIYAALLTSYLVITSWLAVQSRYSWGQRPEQIAFVFIIGVAIMCIMTGMEAMTAPDGLIGGYGPDAYFFIGGIAVFAGLLDFTVLVRKNMARKHKVARHLWRMCFAYFMAVGSLFTGPGATIFPQAVRDSGVLNVPEPLVLLLMLFWLGKTLMTKRKD